MGQLPVGGRYHHFSFEGRALKTASVEFGVGQFPAPGAVEVCFGEVRLVEQCADKAGSSTAFGGFGSRLRELRRTCAGTVRGTSLRRDTLIQISIGDRHVLVVCLNARHTTNGTSARRRRVHPEVIARRVQ
jgi:hypothetical protein